MTIREAEAHMVYPASLARGLIAVPLVAWWGLGCNAILGYDEGELGSGSTGVGGSGAPELEAYAYRRQLTIHHIGPDALPPGYSLSFVIDHAHLVRNGKARSDGSDMRIGREIDGGFLELPRVLDPRSSWNGAEAQLWFQSVDPVNDGDQSYVLFYGLDSPNAPPNDPNQVFPVWNDFDDSAPDYRHFAAVGDAIGGDSAGNGALRISGVSGNINELADSVLFSHWIVSGDFVADVYVTASGGGLSDWSDVGGIMVRQSTDVDSQHVTGSLALSPNAAVQLSYRPATGSPGLYTQVPISSPIPGHVQVTRLGSEVAVAYATADQDWTAVDEPVTMTEPFVDPVLVGVPLGTNQPSYPGWVEVDWFRLRPVVSPGPTVAVGLEQAVSG